YAVAQGELSFDLRRRQPFHALFQDETANDPLVVLRPHDEDVGDRRIGDPHLRAGEAVAAGYGARTGNHGTGIGAVVGLGQSEAADPRAAGELRQVFAALRLAAVGVDGKHHERTLHAHHRPVARVDALDLAGDEPVADVVQSRTAVFRRQRRAEQPARTHLPTYRGMC